MKSKIFYTNDYKDIEQRVQEFLNSHEDFMSLTTVRSTRAVGDAVEGILSESFDVLLGDRCSDYSSVFARRSMADLAFKDKDDFYYIVDVKTHRTSTKFNMPNITSVKRLARFYEDNKNYFVILMVAYDLIETKVVVSDVKFLPIEFFGWQCLTVGALGWGQIQIANSNYIEVNPNYSRKKWMLELCDTLMDFYPKEILKIKKRITWFEKLRTTWNQMPEDI